MKKLALILVTLFLSGVQVVSAQQEKGIMGKINWLNNWTEFQSNKVDYGEPTQILAGNITEDITLTKGEVYLLSGSVFVTNGATLTIEPGAVILGDFETNGSLTISRGSKIAAEGFKTDPIIFTSNRSVKRAGDWGGIIILGDAPINRYGSGSIATHFPYLSGSDYQNTNYGGENVEGSSGTLKYVRIEYAGKRISQDIYFNGLLLASVGAGTVVDHVMVSNSGDDAFLVWGGNIALENLVSFRCKGSDFKFSYGTHSSISNSLAIRSPYTSNGNGSRCLEVVLSQEAKDFDYTKTKTAIEAQNLTFLNDSDDLEAAISMNLIHEAIYVGDGAKLKMSKTVISGFNPAVVLDKEIIVNQESLERIALTEMYFNNCNGNIFVEDNANNDDLENWYGNRGFFNVYAKSSNKETFIASDNYKKPDFRLRINKIIATTNTGATSPVKP